MTNFYWIRATIAETPRRRRCWRQRYEDDNGNVERNSIKLTSNCYCSFAHQKKMRNNNFLVVHEIPTMSYALSKMRSTIRKKCDANGKQTRKKKRVFNKCQDWRKTDRQLNIHLRTHSRRRQWRELFISTTTTSKKWHKQIRWCLRSFAREPICVCVFFFRIHISQYNQIKLNKEKINTHTLT